MGSVRPRQLTKLHGGNVGAATINPEANSLNGTFSYDQFGTPLCKRWPLPEWGRSYMSFL
jgi:hypothetical protein